MRDVYFVGIDGGTQSTKVSIINQRGEILLSASQPLRPMLNRQPGWVEHPDDDLWDSTKAALRELSLEDGQLKAVVGRAGGRPKPSEVLRGVFGLEAEEALAARALKVAAR